jgi:hypothetical protein
MNNIKGRASRGRLIRESIYCDRSATILGVAARWTSDGSPSHVHFLSAHPNTAPDLQVDPEQMTLEICAEIIDRSRANSSSPVSREIIRAAKNLVRAGRISEALYGGQLLSAPEVSVLMAEGLVAMACPTSDDVRKLVREMMDRPSVTIIER